MNVVTAFVHQHHLELPLHQPYRQRRIQSLSTRKNEHLPRRRLQVATRHVLVTPDPVGLRVEEVGSPGEKAVPLHKLIRNGYVGGRTVAQQVGVKT